MGTRAAALAGRLKVKAASDARSARALVADIRKPAAGLWRGVHEMAWAFLDERYARTRRLEYLDAAIGHLERSRAVTPAMHPMRGSTLTNLGLSYQNRFVATGEVADLRAAVRLLREAVGVTPHGHFRRAWCLSNLSMAINDLANAEDAPENLDEAVRLARASVSATSTDHPDRGVIVSNAAGILRARASATDSAADRAEAVRVLQVALSVVPQGHRDRRMIESNLAKAVSDLRQATERQALGPGGVTAADAGRPPPSPERPERNHPPGAGARADLAPVIALFTADLPQDAAEDIRAVADRLGRFAAGDDDAVAEAEALVLGGRLLSMSALDKDAARALGLLAWCRFLADDDPFSTEDLGLAVAMFRDAPAHALPDLAAAVLTVDVPADAEAAAAGAACHPWQLAEASRVARPELTEDLPDDRAAVRLRQAVALTRLAVEGTQPDGELIAAVLDEHADDVQRLFAATLDLSLLPELVRLRRLAVGKSQVGDDETRWALFKLAIALGLTYAWEPGAGLLEEAADALRQSGSIVDEEGEGLPDTETGRASWLSGILQVYFLTTPEEDLDYWHLALAHGTARLDVLAGEDAVPVTIAPPFSETDPQPVMGLDIDAHRIQQAERKLAETSPGDLGRRAGLLAEMADAYRSAFFVRAKESFLDQALELSAQAITLCPADHPARRGCVWCRVQTLDARLNASGDLSRLDDIIAGTRETISLPGDDPPLVTVLPRLATFLMNRFQRDRTWPDLAEAERVLDDALTMADPESVNERYTRGLLGTLTILRLGVGDLKADVTTAIGHLRVGTLLPASNGNLAAFRADLASGLVVRYLTEGDIADLDEAIEQATLGEATVRGAGGWRWASGAYEALANALHLRFQARGADSDLAAAIAAARASLDPLAAGHPRRAPAQARLAELLSERAARDYSPADLEEALRLARAATRDGAHREMLASVLASPAAGPEHRLEALKLARSLVAEAPDGGRRLLLAGLLQAQFLVGVADGAPDVALSVEAEELYRTVLRDDSADQRPRLALGLTLLERARVTGEERLLRDSAGLLQELACDASGPPLDRVTAAQGWGAARALLGDWAAAVAAHSQAVSQLPHLAPLDLSRADRGYWLSQVSDLASDSCAVAVQAGEHRQAIMLFEAARSVIWTQLLAARARLDALAEVAPDLAARFARIRDDLDASAMSSRRWDLAYAWRGKAATPGSLASSGNRSAQLWRDLLAEVAALDGFADLSGLSGSEAGGRLHPGVAGPVVILAASDYGSCALVLFPDDRIEAVALPGADASVARERERQLREAVAVLADRDSSLAARQDGEAQIRAVQEWTGRHVTGPILDLLGQDGQDAARVWWIPGGPLAALPVHAGGNALHRACSSYATSLAALRTTAALPLAAPSRVLAVAMPETPGQRPLPQARSEANWLRDSYTAIALIGPDATRAAVLAELPRAGIAHFACHSAAGADHGLLLADHQDNPLSVADLIRLRLPGAHLAYLSSCSTALGATGLPDEAMHLAAAFSHAGFRHVIASLWPLADPIAPRVTREFYPRLLDDGHDPAQALREASLALAAEYPGNPSRWACLTHFGILCIRRSIDVCSPTAPVGPRMRPSSARPTGPTRAPA